MWILHKWPITEGQSLKPNVYKIKTKILKKKKRKKEHGFKTKILDYQGNNLLFVLFQVSEGNCEEN